MQLRWPRHLTLSLIPTLSPELLCPYQHDDLQPRSRKRERQHCSKKPHALLEKCEHRLSTHQDEGADEEVAVGQADLHTAEKGVDGSAVGGEVGQVPGDEGGGGHGGLEEANVGVTIDGLNHLVVLGARATHRGKSQRARP